MSESAELQAHDKNVEVIRCHFLLFQRIDENDNVTLTSKLVKEDLEFHIYTQRMKNRIRKRTYDNIGRTNYTHFYVYGLVCYGSSWMFVNEYSVDGKEIHVTTTQLTSELHCVSRVGFCSKPVIQNGTLEKKSVGVKYSINDMGCAHSCDISYLMDAYEGVENSTMNIYEYLRHYLFELYVNYNSHIIEKHMIDSYDILQRVFYNCLKYYDVLVSMYLIRLFFRCYYQVHKSFEIISEKCDCYHDFHCDCDELINFNFV